VIAEFEQRFAAVLGPRLDGVFANRVEVAPGSVDPPRIVLAVTRVEPLEPDFGSRRREPVEAHGDDFRRVLRLRCTVGLEVEASADGGRAEERAGLDDALFALDAADLQDGTALDATGDPGFVIQELRIVDSSSPLADDTRAITVRATGWFWPVGAPTEAGERIGEVQLREALLPVELVPAAPPLVAGGPAVELAVRVATTPLIRIKEGAPPAALPFGELAVRAADDAGGPGAGSLSGGADVGDGTRMVELVDGAATVTYTPPADPVVDYLLVELDSRDDGGRRVRVGRVPLTVRGA
jgi:hypothetical protein